MRTSDKVFLILLGAIGIFGGAFVVYRNCFWNGMTVLEFLLRGIVSNGQLLKAVSVLIGAVLVIIGTSLCIIASNSSMYKRYKRNDVVKLANDGNGITEISFEALRVIAKRKCTTFKFVSECSTDVEVVKDGLAVTVKMRPYSNVELPAAVKQLQEELADSIVKQTGLRAVSISVLILPCENK